MPLAMPIVLSIAGSDSGGGAGIQADLKTFHAFHAFGTTAITAITVQNTRGVRDVHPVPIEVIRGQIAAVVEDLPPVAYKTGMLATAEVVRAVAAEATAQRLPNLVLDPVMVATSGDRLLAREAERSIVHELLPLARLVTPNLDEAEILAGFEVRDEAGMRRAAARLVELGAGAALLKGGHLRSAELVDVLFDGEEWHEWRHARIDTTSTHGTGCTLSAAIAAGLAHGHTLRSAVDAALDFVARAIREAPGLGGGNGPLNHFVPPAGGASATA